MRRDLDEGDLQFLYDRRKNVQRGKMESFLRALSMFGTSQEALTALVTEAPEMLMRSETVAACREGICLAWGLDYNRGRRIHRKGRRHKAEKGPKIWE